MNLRKVYANVDPICFQNAFNGITISLQPTGPDNFRARLPFFDGVHHNGENSLSDVAPPCFIGFSAFVRVIEKREGCYRL